MPTPRRHQPPLALRIVRTAMRHLSRVAPATAAKLAFLLWHYPRRHPEPRREQTWRESSRQHSLEYLDGQLTFYQWGEGPPVLLVHGWDGRATQMGAFAEPLVAAGYSALALDLPAHGRSSGKRTNMLESAAAIKFAAGSIGPLAGIIGHSFGAGASAKAVADGTDTAKAILISPPANLRWLIDNYHRLLDLSDEATRQLELTMVARYGESIWQQVSADQNMARAALPGLIIHDQDDRDVPFSQAELLSQAWPQARLVRTTGLGHRRILRDKSVIDRCVEFIRRD